MDNKPHTLPQMNLGYSLVGHSRFGRQSHCICTSISLFVQSEYIASSDCRREFISGFSGSAGMSIGIRKFQVPVEHCLKTSTSTLIIFILADVN